MKAFSKIAALTMALLVFLTSMSYAIDLHYCGGELESFSFFGKAQQCKKEQAAEKENSSSTEDPHACCKKKNTEKEEVKSCHQNKTKASSKKCCENKKVEFESDTEAHQPLQQEVSNVHIAVAYVVAAFNYNLDLVVAEQKDDHYLYKEPPLLTDAQLAYQIFRI